MLITTARGSRSFWVKNLQKQPRVRYYLGGKPRDSKAFVMAPGKQYRRPKSLPPILGRVTDFLAPYRNNGWAFALLMPAADP